jgi:hypothetical protein
VLRYMDDDGYRQLGIAVIVQAARDLQNSSDRIASDAEHFLRGADAYFLWTAVAEVDAGALWDRFFANTRKDKTAG